ncbi:pyridoxine/pyridoxamine 5'-phosphate oxidase [Arthrobacter halodurans]|uniref:Pyridoxal 5'-phosphate synthase n=1 Tax=Arthrobacter halodurans TaxID=516699 RepID=A0ABV4UN94_9MICC
MSASLGDFLRGLPDFPENLPDFDVASAPADPAALFRAWLEEAAAAGVRQPHACSLATVGAEGQPSSRMVLLKNIDADGWHFATSRTSRKGTELTANPRAALNFFWADQGRQVRVVGKVVELSAEASAADWRGRPADDGRDNPHWQLYAVLPREIEFWQGRHDRKHIRHIYRPGVQSGPPTPFPEVVSRPFPGPSCPDTGSR